MKDQIDVSVRRSPKYAAFMAVGAILGVLVILMGLALMGMLTFLQRTTTPSFTPRTGLAGQPRWPVAHIGPPRQRGKP